MSPIRVSFKRDGKTVRGRLIQFLAVPFRGVVALVEYDQSIIQIAPSKLKVLKGRR